MMLFGLFRPKSIEHEDDVATGTFADGMIGMPLSDAFVRSRERNQAFRHSVDERDYSIIRLAGQMGAGLVP
ncbi:hypothetical protein D0Y60_23315 [Shinella sp. WSJ-2]|uniref:hypothetical protein n=1 Tax=Shinella sp. WSJ-2 TaxID=2303749 RepID=UPI000E3E3C60|nr:hypothetical protein [Shinella sp. WSJ-2]RFZ81993.1 hypothetical protein D0Y60_23315 [Shinella sp. WSJ-2]